MGVQPNALLAKPPRAYHRGLRAKAEDYEGVHTTSSLPIAAAYAMSAWRQAGAEDASSYPVILVLDVGGLAPKPDVDAMRLGAEALGWIQSDVKEMLDEGATVDEIAEAGEMNEPQYDAAPGDPPAAFIFEHIPRDPFRSLVEALEREGLSPEGVRQQLQSFAEFGPSVLPGVVLSEVVDQQRYLTDIDLDRVHQVLAFQPWWEEVLEPWWELEDEQLERKAKSIEEGGWRLWTMEDQFDIQPDPIKVVYESRQLRLPGAPAPRTEYHGTLSDAVNEAFSGLIDTDPPFAVD